MAFVTAAAPTFAAFQTALETAITGAGWTAGSPSSGQVYSLGASSHNFGIEFGANTVRAVPFRGAASGAAWNAQTDTVPSATTVGNQVEMGPLAASMENYWIFSEEISTGLVAYVHAVCEVTPGIFAHLAIGVLEKSSAYTGGMYVTSSYFSGTPARGQNNAPFDYGRITSKSRADYVSLVGFPQDADQGYSIGDLFVKDRIGMVDVSMGLGAGAGSSNIMELWTAQTNPQNGLAALVPPYSLITNSAITQRFFLGSPHAMRLVNMDVHAPASVLTLGSDDWYFFPLHTKGTIPEHSDGTNASSTNVSHSGFFGFAYKRVN